MPRASERERAGTSRGSARGGGEREERESARKSGFSYRGRTSEDVSRRAKQTSGRYDKILTEDLPWFKPREGENCIRLLPWLNGEDPDFEKLDEKWGNHWGIDIIIHNQVGPDKGGYLCLDKMNGEPCPICEAWRTDDIDEIKPGDRVLCWLIDRNDEKAGPKLWSMPLGVSKDFSAASTIKGSGEILLIDDPEEGYDIYFDREGEKKLTKYKRIEVAREPSPLHDEEKKQNKWLDYISEHRLPDMLKFYDADYLEKVLSGQISASERDDDEDEDDDRGSSRRGGRSSRGRDDVADTRPSRSRSRSRDEVEDAPRTRRGRAEPEAEDEDGEVARPARRGRGAEPEEEAEPEPAPSRRRRGEAAEEPAPSRRRARAEPEPDEEPEVDAEPDDPPPRRGGTVARRRVSPKTEVEDDDIPFEEGGDKEEVAAARSRLKNVGKRGRK